MPPPPDETSGTDKLTGWQKLGVASTGLTGLANIFNNPSPGKVISDQFSESDIEQFIQNLVNQYQLTNTSNLVNTAAETGGTQRFDLDPQTQQLLNRLIGQYSNQLTPDLRGYEAGGIQNINRGSDLQQQALSNIMATRGLSRSPVAGNAAGNVENERFGQISQFRNQLPLLQNQIQNENLAAAGNFFQAIPKNISTTGYNVGQQSQAGQTSTVGQTSSQQTGRTSSDVKQHGTQETIAPKESTLSKILRGVGTLGATAATIFSDKELKKDIHPITKATDIIMKLKPVEWNWRKGVIAQDLEKVLPDLVHTDPAGSGFKKVNYAGLIPYLVSAVQELKQEAAK